MPPPERVFRPLRGFGGIALFICPFQGAKRQENFTVSPCFNPFNNTSSQIFVKIFFDEKYRKIREKEL